MRKKRLIYLFYYLFTSRETKEYIPQYFLDIMSVEDARELFLKHYPTNEMDKVDKILGYLDYHTLFIEITAKTLKQRKRTLSLDKMIEKFANGEFSSIKKNKRESFNLFLSDLFSNDKILQDEETLLFLKRLSVLPSIEISFEDLYKFLVCEDEERLEDFLIELVDNGWLIESEHAYKFHQILKEFVYDKYLPTFEEINGIVNSFIKLIGDTGDTKVAIDNKNYIPYFESLVEIFDRTKIENWWIGNFLGRFANVYFELDFFEKAEYIYLKTLKICQNILGEEHGDTATTYNNLAGFYMSMGEYLKAEVFYLKALKIREKLDFPPDTAQSYSNLANLYISMKKYDKIKSFHLNALKIRVKIYGKNHSTIAISYSGLASFYKSIGKYKKAELFYLKALKIAKNELGDKHPDTSAHHKLLAELYELIKENEKAEIHYLSALKISEKILGEEHSSTIKIYNDLALLYDDIGKYQKAVPLYLKILKKDKKRWGENHLATANLYNNLALNYFFMEEYKKAESFYLKALKIRKKILGERHSDTASSYNNLGSLYFYQDNYKKAYPYTKKAFEIGLKVLSNEHPDLMNYKEGLEMIEEELSGSESFFKYIMQKTNNGKNIDMGNEDKIEILFQNFLIKLMKNFLLNQLTPR